MLSTYQMSWWHSIRWRMALGSVLVTLLAICLLMLAALGAIVFSFEGEQNSRMHELAESGAQQIGVEYSALLSKCPSRPALALFKSAQMLRLTLAQHYVMVVFRQHSNMPVFPWYQLAHPSGEQAKKVAAFVHHLGLEQKAGNLLK